MILRYLKVLFSKILFSLNKIGYCRAKGVRLGGGGCVILGKFPFGSEPYLVKIGNSVRINNGVRFITHDGSMWVLRNLYDELENMDLFGTIDVGDNVQIGENAIIMPNVKIGNNCIIGACAVVTHDVPDNSVVAGVPARVIEDVDTYRKKHILDSLPTKKLSEKHKREYLDNIYASKT